MSTVLSAEEVQQYKEQGYLFPKYHLPDPLLARLRDGIDRLLAAYTDVAQEDLANPHMISPTEGAHMNPFMETARHGPILDMVGEVLGPDLVLWITRVLCKPPIKGREVPWHQDGEYWPMRPLATCSVWIAIDPVSAVNGCMRFIPGSHKQHELYRHHTTSRENLVLNLELDRDQFDESAAVDVELEPGEMSLHDVRMIHGSLANTSGKRRAALILRYMPATSHYDRLLVAQRKDNSPFNIFDQPLWLMRGVDRSGKNDFSHGHELWKRRYAGGLALPKGSEG
ncbi:MAG TPA: phytanoyl-CoA dioxygenase family protein [Burkholderiales bacterium]|nr:phytanoyl-CoA dioxygenase family protein [Burkholderiales bacterium]